MSSLDGLNSTTTCGDYFQLETWLKYSLLASIPIVVLFCFLQQRVNLWPSFLGGRPGVAFPVNLVETYSDRGAFAVAFASMATTIIEVESDLAGDPAQLITVSTVPEMLQGTLTFLTVIGRALLVSLAFYPTFLCLNTDYKLIGNTIGLFYSLIWTVYYFARVLGCTSLTIVWFEILFSVALGTWLSVPGFIFSLLVTLRFLYGMCKIMYCSRCKVSKLLCVEHVDGSDPDFKATHFYKRTKFLLTPPVPENFGGNIVSRWFRKYFGSVEGYKFSRQNICVLTLTCYVTCLVAVINMISCGNVAHGVRVSLERQQIFSQPLYISVLDQIVSFLKSIEAAAWASAAIALVATLLSIVDAQLRYKKHTLQLWKGDRSFCPARNFRIETMMVASLRYMGYRVIMTAAGFLIMFLVLWVAFVFLKYCFVWVLRKYWLTFVLFLALYFTQIFLSRLVFLQRDDDQEGSRSIFRKKSYLGLDNRRIFHVVLYFTFFVNILIGIFATVSRILKSVVIGTIFIGRLDRCAMQRGWEVLDPGFKAYIGFLQLEVAHTHPVLITFCHFLNEAIYLRKLTTAKPTTEENIYSIEEDFRQTSQGRGVHLAPFSPQDEPSRKISVRVRNRWLLALTLSRNPSLIPERRVPIKNPWEEFQGARGADAAPMARPNNLGSVVLTVALPQPSGP